MASRDLQMASCEGQMASCEGHPDASKMIWQYHGSNTYGVVMILYCLVNEGMNPNQSIFLNSLIAYEALPIYVFRLKTPPQFILCECKLNLNSSNCLLFQSSHTTMDKLPMCICRLFLFRDVQPVWCSRRSKSFKNSDSKNKGGSRSHSVSTVIL